MRQNDVNAIYQKLEEYYDNTGSYPTEKITSDNVGSILEGIDSGAVVDNDGNGSIVTFTAPDDPYIRENLTRL